MSAQSYFPLFSAHVILRMAAPTDYKIHIVRPLLSAHHKQTMRERILF